jgi:hypothetical protein
MVRQALNGADKLMPVGIQNGDMMQPGVTDWGRCAVFAHKRVQRDVMVITASRQQTQRQANRTSR